MAKEQAIIQRKITGMHRWIYVVQGIAIMVILGTVYSYSVFRIALETKFRIGPAESGMPYMTALAFYALFMFLTGKYIDRFQPRVVLMFGAGLVSLGLILSTFASSILVLTITYGAVGGAGVGIAYGVPLSVVAKWFPEKKGLAVGLVLVGFGMSPLITAPIAGALVDAYGVMSAFLILGISFGILLPIMSYPSKYPSNQEHKGFNSKERLEDDLTPPIGKLIRSKDFIGLYLNFLIGTMIGLTMIGKTTSIGVEYARLSNNDVTKYMAIFAVSNGLGRPFFGWLTDRFQAKKVMLLSYLLVAIAAILFLSVGQRHVWGYIIAFLLFWFNLGGWLAIAPAMTLRLYGMKRYSRYYGLVFTAYGVGALLGVSTSGLLVSQHGNYNFVFYFVLGLCVLGTLLTMGFISADDKQVH